MNKDVIYFILILIILIVYIFFLIKITTPDRKRFFKLKFYRIISNVSEKKLNEEKSLDLLSMHYEKHAQNDSRVKFNSVVDLIETILYDSHSLSDKFFKKIYSVPKDENITDFLINILEYARLKYPFFRCLS